jgi:acyl dehydratase
MLYFEDLKVGAVACFGSYPVTREEVIEFASKYDPQPFHLSDEAAAKTQFGKVAASGWHTCSMTMRMLVDSYTTNAHAGLGSPGVDSIRFLRPVYPGDTLTCETELLEKRQSRSRPEMGITRTAIRVFNQGDEQVLDMQASGLIQVRGN